MMKFKILPLVHGMRIKGVRYPPGSVVDLPDRYLGVNYLQPVKEEVPVNKAEPEAPVEPETPHKDEDALKLMGVAVKRKAKKEA